MKIGFLGLDGCGKTSFISIYHKNFGDIMDLKPTKGIERSTGNVAGEELFIWNPPLTKSGCSLKIILLHVFSII